MSRPTAARSGRHAADRCSHAAAPSAEPATTGDATHRQAQSLSGDRGGCRALRRPAEHAPATIAEAGAPPHHAGDDAITIRNLRRAQPEHIAGAQPSLIVLGESAARPRRQCQRDGQPRHRHIQVPLREQISSHHRPQFARSLPSFAPCHRFREAAAAAESNHDTSIRTFNKRPSPCTTILPAVASSTPSAAAGCSRRRQIVITRTQSGPAARTVSRRSSGASGLFVLSRSWEQDHGVHDDCGA